MKISPQQIIDFARFFGFRWPDRQWTWRGMKCKTVNGRYIVEDDEEE